MHDVYPYLIANHYRVSKSARWGGRGGEELSLIGRSGFGGNNNNTFQTLQKSVLRRLPAYDTGVLGSQVPPSRQERVHC